MGSSRTLILAVMTKEISILVYCESDGMTNEVSVMEMEEQPLVNN